ncbi:MAG: GrpB family protein [Marvinbryantia sp.]|jgi:GrpB-like predicted nucleotidyltransferase (UPF0157 family)
MIGLKRGTVKLMVHQKEWTENAEHTMEILREILGSAALDIQHVGSTSIFSICAKPIIDLVVGVRDLNDIQPYMEQLKQNGIIFRGGDAPEQLLFVMGDFENDTRTHHIHVVKWNGEEWKNYVNFRDYLNANVEKARLYEECKQKLARQFPNDRGSYTAGKEEVICQLLQEASTWRTSSISGYG